jgi:uncharacterized protein (TIGR00290 family)
MKTPLLVSWSGGKDCALALQRVLDGGEYEPVTLLTTVNPEYERVVMHGVRRELIEAQADALNLPLHAIELPASPNNDLYNQVMSDAMNHWKARGVHHVMFGDIWLEDVKQYRDERLKLAQMTGVFPVWGDDVHALAQEFLNRGFASVAACVDTEQLDASFAGRVLDESFFRDLPDSVDPCGERGEFHSFVFRAPMFRRELKIATGEKVLRAERFMYCDLLLDG